MVEIDVVKKDIVVVHTEMMTNTQPQSTRTKQFRKHRTNTKLSSMYTGLAALSAETHCNKHEPCRQWTFT